MTDDSFRTIRILLGGTDPEELRKGLKLAEEEITKADSENARSLFEMVSTLFYIDTLDHPELAPVLDEAVNLMARFGSWIIPILVANLDEGDLKAQIAFANVLGRIGADAIDPLRVPVAGDLPAAGPTRRRTLQPGRVRLSRGVRLPNQLSHQRRNRLAGIGPHPSAGPGAY